MPRGQRRVARPIRAGRPVCAVCGVVEGDQRGFIGGDGVGLGKVGGGGRRRGGDVGRAGRLAHARGVAGLHPVRVGRLRRHRVIGVGRGRRAGVLRKHRQRGPVRARPPEQPVAGDGGVAGGVPEEQHAGVAGRAKQARRRRRGGEGRVGSVSVVVIVVVSVLLHLQPGHLVRVRRTHPVAQHILVLARLPCLDPDRIRPGQQRGLNPLVGRPGRLAAAALRAAGRLRQIQVCVRVLLPHPQPDRLGRGQGELVGLHRRGSPGQTRRPKRRLGQGRDIAEIYRDRGEGVLGRGGGGHTERQHGQEKQHQTREVVHE